MLYPENKSDELKPETFKNPGAEYRGAPFWAWNCELNEQTLLREIEAMKAMGFGGFHMHPRVGMTTEYLGSGFMTLVRACAEKARQERMLAWLYDEDKWPSGAAGGLVTKDERFRARYLRFSQTPGQGEPLARYAVRLDRNGCLAAYRRLKDDEKPVGVAGKPPAHENEEQVRYASLCVDGPSPWFNMQTYVDTLSRPAVERFVEVTHERYLKLLGRDFGTLVPAIFTDEPQSPDKEPLPEATSCDDARLPWTDDLPATYRKACGEDILDALPEIFWELPAGVSQARYRFHDHVAERFAQAFADTVGRWCEKHNLMLTGHMMREENLDSQTYSLGDCMRSYRSFQLPGIDMLCDRRELTTAKQAQSAARQYGRPGVLSELYGVTNWNFRFYQHKLQGDWQAALGVSVRVPHLYWVSMRGEAKRDYPASIGHQSPWYREYKWIEDHFARVNSAMTRGKAIVKIAVIHPVESYWLHYGPEAQTKDARDEMEERFAQLPEWLLYNQLDFDYICESLLPDQYDAKGEGFTVGEMHYDVILAPNMETIRGTTLRALQEFAAKGGRVIYAGRAPEYVDARPGSEACRLRAETIGWSKRELLRALEPYRLHSVTERGGPAENLFSQWREDGNCCWLFLCHVNGPEKIYETEARRLQIDIKGAWCAELYDTFTGDTRPLPAEYDDGRTVLDWQAYPQDSLLLKLTPGRRNAYRQEALEYQPLCELPPLAPVTLGEPNVLVLDMPEYALDDEAWQSREEILRVCDKLKERLGLRNEIAEGCQPWVMKEEAAASNTVRLRYKIDSQIALGQVQLAVEDLDVLKLSWNHIALGNLSKAADGYYVDEAFQVIRLGALKQGENILEIEKPFGKVTTLESCYLLGDFGVEVRGRTAKIIGAVKELAFGSWVHQGLPFYGGNVTYHAQVELKHEYGSAVALDIPHFAQPVLGVSMDGNESAPIALSPFRAELGRPAPEVHTIDVTAYGNRINTFGALHSCDHTRRWHGPDAWRTEGDDWSYEYVLQPCGILKAPVLLSAELQQPE